MRVYFLFVIIVFIGCSTGPTTSIVGTWRCDKAERIGRPTGQSMASSLGEEMVVSEKVSDTLIFKPDNTYDEFISAFGVGNHIKGKYLFSPSEGSLQLTKNADAPGSERGKDFSINKLTNDSLIINDNKGFKFLYLRLETNEH
jgi:hypothetical protein